MVEQTYAAWNAGVRNILDVLPTGGGKSVLMSKITLDGVQQGMRQGIIAHRNELVTQMSCHVARQGIYHRIIGSDATVKQATRQHRTLFNGQSFVNPKGDTGVIGVDTLIKRKNDIEKWLWQLNRWKIDEAHHVLRENKWGKAVSLMPNAIGLGVTATACRADRKGLGREYDGVFDQIVLGPTMRELIRRGFLSDYEIACPTSDLELSDDDVSENGDWSNQTLRKAVKKTENRIVGDVVSAWCKFAFMRRTIVFATDVETAGEIAQRFRDCGINAMSLSGETPTLIREKYIEDFKEGRLTVLINVDLFDEGFDVPACDVVMMARPTASLGKYRQMVGRALRYMIGKVALIIDLVSNIVRHGLPDKETLWTLARGDKRGKQEKDPNDIDLTICKNERCVKPYPKFMVACPHCHMEPPLPIARERSIKTVNGDLVLLDREALERMRIATILEAPADVAARVAAVAGAIAGKGALNKQMAKIAEHGRISHAIAQWAAIERQKGLNDREILKKFYLTTGMDVLTALDGSRPRAEMESIANTIEGWYSRAVN